MNIKLSTEDDGGFFFLKILHKPALLEINGVTLQRIEKKYKSSTVKVSHIDIEEDEFLLHDSLWF